MNKYNVNKELVEYIEEFVIPLYEKLDLAHKSFHVYDVIESSFIISKEYELNHDIIFTVAAFHDIGLLVDRKNHHIIGANIVKDDMFLNSYFNKEDINIISEAVEDHRASTTNKPRSIYGLIVSEADLYDHSLMIIERTILYRLNDNINIDFNTLYTEVKYHISAKYGYNGYLKSWLNSKRVYQMLKELRDYLDNEVIFKDICLDIYNRLIGTFD